MSPSRVGNHLSSRQRASASKVVRMIRILDKCVPTEAPTFITPVLSQRGFHGFRVAGTTLGVPWFVELYGGNFYVVQVGNLQSTPFNTPLHVVNYLRTHLRQES